MIGLALLIAASQAQTSLQYYQGSFLIESSGFVLPVSTQSQPAAPDFVRFRRGDTYTVWDKRGLAIRNGHWIYDTRFKELSVSPKLFSKDQIHANLEAAAKGQRFLEASALSGALRLGTDAYFVPRWIDKKGYTWLEVLVKVDLSVAKPKPELLGKFEGLTLASGSIDHRLFPLNEEPAAIVRRAGNWGVSVYDPVAEQFTYTNIGTRLRAYALLGDRDVAYIEAEQDELNRVGTANLATGDRTDVLEDRGAIRVLDDQRPLCAIVATPDKTTLRNLETSAAMDLPANANVVRTLAGALVWWPQKNPKHALLLDPERWDGLANWQGVPTAAPTEAPAELAKPPSLQTPVRSQDAALHGTKPRRRTVHHPAL